MEKARQTYRQKYQIDPEYRQKNLERAQSRYHTDEEYRKKTIERSRKRREGNPSKERKQTKT